jgi:23S rRNA pseudouridine1911/1915/1917 synthase
MNSSFVVSKSERLDKFLASTLEISRNQIEHFIKNEFVKVNEKIVSKTGLKLKENDNVEVMFPEVEPSEPMEIDFDVEVIYEDDDILVVNKPSGLIVHPAPSVKGATLVDWLKKKGISLSTISGEERHGIVHRIDKETTGTLVIAKNNESHQILSEQLQDKSMGRVYLALIDLPLKDDIEIDEKIGRNPNNRLKKSINSSGKEAKTRFIKIANNEISKIELISAKLFTGRTHQIRVHLAHINRHILGDFLYGYKKDDKIPRVMLHAYYLYLKHPRTNEIMYFKADLFDDMKEIIDNNFSKDIYEKIEPKDIISKFNDFDDNRLY